MNPLCLKWTYNEPTLFEINPIGKYDEILVVTHATGFILIP